MRAIWQIPLLIAANQIMPDGHRTSDTQSASGSSANFATQPRSLRIAYVIDSIETGQAGTESQLLKLIRGLGKHNEIDLYCLGNSPWLSANQANLPCKVHAYAVRGRVGWQVLREIVRLVRTMRSRRHDVVHTFFPVGNIVGVIAARLAGVRHIVSSRRDLGIWMNWRYLVATRLANRLVSRIIVNSNEVKRYTERMERFAGRRIEVVYNGVDVDTYQRVQPNSALRRSLGLREQSKVVGLVANFRPVKGQHTLVRAAWETLQCRDDVEFLLVGGSVAQDGARYREQTQELASRLGVSDRVHFVDASDQVASILSLLDVAVSCSEHEGLSNAIIEYMAAGVPCIVTAAGGNLDLVQNEVTGLTFCYDDAHALAQHIVRLLVNPADGERFSSNALARVQRLMSLDAMIAGNLGIYQQLLAS